MIILEDVILFATDAHKGQKDKSGQPYILHPLTVMMSMDTMAEKRVALLHDIVEDTNFTIANLMDMGLPEDEIMAVDALTKKPDQDYMDMIKKVKLNSLARKVKIKDLEHNMNLKRTLGREEMTEKDKDRIAKYYQAWSYLTGE